MIDAKDLEISYLKNVVKASKDLRVAQRNYLVDRGNEGLGKKVAEAAYQLDLIINAYENSFGEVGEH